MRTINDVLDKVDNSLMDLINANSQFAKYRSITSGKVSSVILTGSAQLVVSPKQHLGLVIEPRR